MTLIHLSHLKSVIMLVSFRVVTTSILAFFALCAYLRTPCHLSEDVRYQVDGLRDRRWPSITGHAFFGKWEDASRKLKSACREEASDAHRIKGGTFAVDEAVDAAEDQNEVKDGAMNDDVSHTERMQRLEQAAKDPSRKPPQVDDERVQRPSKQEEVQSLFTTNSERLSKAAEVAPNGEVAEPAKSIETDQVEDWSANQIARAREASEKAAAAARIDAEKEDDARRKWEGKATRTNRMESARNGEEDWQRNQLERVAEMKAG